MTLDCERRSLWDYDTEPARILEEFEAYCSIHYYRIHTLPCRNSVGAFVARVRDPRNGVVYDALFEETVLFGWRVIV